MLLIALSSNSIYLIYSKYVSMRSISLVLSIAFLLVSVQTLRLRRNVQYIRLVNFLGIYFLYIALFILISKFYVKTEFVITFVMLLPISVIYFFVRALDSNLLLMMRRLVNVIAFLSIISLVAWVLFSNLHLLPGSKMYSPWSGSMVTNYWWLHFDVQSDSFFGLVVMRNTGVFTEAPMFAYVLLCGLFIELFINYKCRKKVCALLLVTVLTTFSTTGIIFGVVAIFVKLLVTYYQKLNKTFLIAGIIVLIAIVAMVQALLGQKSGSYSAMARSDDMQAGLKAWYQSPFIGNGFENMNVIYRNMATWRRQAGNLTLLGFTSGILKILNDGGIMLFAVYVLPLINFLRSRNNLMRSKRPLLLMSFMLLTLVVTITPYTSLTVFLVAFEYAYYFVCVHESDEFESSNIG